MQDFTVKLYICYFRDHSFIGLQDSSIDFLCSLVVKGDKICFFPAKLDLRLTLFYLCNEVVQTCKRKHAIVFKDAFKEVLKDAALLVR